MGKRYQDKIDVFFGGKSRDSRIQDPSVFEIAQHFDILKYPKRLTPMPSMEADESAAPSTDLITNFAYKNNNLYGLGKHSSGYAKVFDKASDPVGGTFAASTTGADASGAASSQQAFTMYHNVVFGLTALARIWAYNTVTNAFTATALNLTSFVNTCRGLVTRDDLFIQPYDNKVAVKDGEGAGVTANWEAARLTVLDDYIITDLCEIGDMVALAARPKTIDRHSKVFLWDKLNADIIDSIDFGVGALKIIDVIDGELVGISEQYGTTASLNPSQGVLIFRKWTSGPQAQVFMEIPGDFNTTLTLYGNHVKASDGRKIIFGCIITIDGTAYKQLWMVGRAQPADPFAVTPYVLVDNDTAITSIEGMFLLEQFLFVAHNADGSINRSQDSTSVTTRHTGSTPIYISQKIDGSRGGLVARRNKIMRMVGLMFEKLVSTQSVTLSLKKDGDTSFTEVFTESTAGAISREAGRFVTGDAEFDKGKEYQFKVTSTKGAVPTGIYFDMEQLDGDISET